MKKIAVLTSGGDSPGMNAAIRAVVRCGLDRDMEVYGIKNGFEGLLDGEIEPMNRYSEAPGSWRTNGWITALRC